MKLEPERAARLQRLLLMLASPHAGEVIATRDAIGRLLEASGLDWHDLAAASTCASIVTAAASPRRTPNFGDLARECRDLDRGRLTPRERDFVADMVRRGFAFQPSSRQAAWLDDILAWLQGRAAA